jgi:hypothetical protein
VSVAPILTRALRYGGILAVAIAVLGAGIGLLVAGMPGVVAALVGAGIAAVFTALTAGSILLAARVAAGDLGGPVFFGIVMGSWLLKLVLFLVLVIWLRGQAWLDPYVFFGAVVAVVLGSLVADVVAFQRSRVPYVSDVQLPGDADRP